MGMSCLRYYIGTSTGRTRHTECILERHLASRETKNLILESSGMGLERHQGRMNLPESNESSSRMKAGFRKGIVIRLRSTITRK